METAIPYLKQLNLKLKESDRTLNTLALLY